MAHRLAGAIPRPSRRTRCRRGSPPVGAVVPVNAVDADCGAHPLEPHRPTGGDPASGAHEEGRGPARTAVGAGDADAPDLRDPALAPISDPDPTPVWDAAEMRRMAAARRAAQAEAAPPAEAELHPGGGRQRGGWPAGARSGAGGGRPAPPAPQWAGHPRRRTSWG